jgi:hypothetical protein
MHRRELLKGLTIVVAAPFVIRTPGLLMPVRDRGIPSYVRDWDRFPPSIAEVRAWRSEMNWIAERGIMLSFNGIGAARIGAMGDAEKRFKAIGLL